MAAKTTGAEFKRFYADKTFWPEGAYHDDDVVIVDGVQQDDLDTEKLADAAKVVIDSGVVFLSPDDFDGVAFDTYFKRWKKAQTTRTIVIEVDALKLDAVIASVKAIGGKVV